MQGKRGAGEGAMISNKSHAVLRQFMRFVAVGAVSTSAHYAVLIALKEIFGVGPVIATTIGYAVGAVIGYTLNRRFTFDARPAFARGFAKYVAVVVIGAGVNAAAMALLTEAGMHYLLAQLIATTLGLFWNFAGSRLIVFRA